jgi:hypothetical protein
MKRAIGMVIVAGLALATTAASPGLSELREILARIDARVATLETQMAGVLIDIEALLIRAEQTDDRLQALEVASEQIDVDLNTLENTVARLPSQTGVLVNSAGGVVGPLFLDVRDDAALSRKLWVTVFRPEGNFLFEVRTGGGLFAEVQSALFHESANCSGPPMVFNLAWPQSVFAAQVQIGSEMWQGTGNDRFTTIRSSRTGSSGICTPLSSTFSATMEEVAFAFDLSELGSGFSVQ